MLIDTLTRNLLYVVMIQYDSYRDLMVRSPRVLAESSIRFEVEAGIVYDAAGPANRSFQCMTQEDPNRMSSGVTAW
jgi:hypothetical protein